MEEPAKETTIYDMAKALNISASTVSRALSGHFSVSKKTRQKVLAMAEQLSYQSNQMASNLRLQKSNTIGVIVGNLNSSFMSNAIFGIEEILSEAGYNIIISQSLDRKDKEIAIAQTMFNNRVAGLLVSIAYETEDDEHFKRFKNKNIPLIYFDRGWKESTSPCIEIDNEKAAYELTSHLIKEGFRNIAHVTAFKISSVAEARFLGYKKALADYKLSFNDNLLFKTDLTKEAGIQVAEQILALIEKPDAIFFTNDACAVSCMQHLKAHGVKIPTDIAIAGFNNDSEASIIEPGLTTINYPGHVIGKIAARQLLETINHETAAKAINIEHELVVRASTSANRLL